MDANLENTPDLCGKLEESADNLFESKLGESELQVCRTFKTRGDEACRIGFEDASSVLEIKTLVEQVRIGPMKDWY